MPTRKGPNNQATVPVLDKNGTPLSPARPSRVRSWLESGRASKVWSDNIFAVQLHDIDAANANAITQPMTLGLDIGKTTGISITRESEDGSSREIVGAYEHIHRNNEIRDRLADRRDYRKGRRHRLRRRPQRSKNRANALAKGRISPSLRNLIEDYHHITDTMCKLYPITRIRVEYLKFDTQLIQNQDISGEEYQYGTLEHRQLRRYILTRDTQHLPLLRRARNRPEQARTRPRHTRVQGGTHQARQYRRRLQALQQEKAQQGRGGLPGQ